jgi:hypothetical protein
MLTDKGIDPKLHRLPQVAQLREAVHGLHAMVEQVRRTAKADIELATGHYVSCWGMGKNHEWVEDREGRWSGSATCAEAFAHHGIETERSSVGIPVGCRPEYAFEDAGSGNPARRAPVII